MDEVFLTRTKGNEESLTEIKMNKGRMSSSKGNEESLKGGGTTEVRKQLRIPRPR